MRKILLALCLAIMIPVVASAEKYSIYLGYYLTQSYNEVMLENGQQVKLFFENFSGKKIERIDKVNYRVPDGKGKNITIELPGLVKSDLKEFSKKIECQINDGTPFSLKVMDDTFYKSKESDKGSVSFYIWLGNGLNIDADSDVKIIIHKKNKDNLVIQLSKDVVAEWDSVNKFVFTKEFEQRLKQGGIQKIPLE